MKVKELISRLKQVKNQNADVYVLDDYGEAHTEPEVVETDDGDIEISGS